MPSISLNDLLDKHGAPQTIDYISVDTEGSEYDILEAFDFARWNVLCFTVEHNFTPNQKRIDDLMTARGYERKFKDFSRFDAWYRKRGG